jgi:ABC-type transporter MlaC component
MAADRIDPKDVEDLMRRTAARLAQPDPQGGSALQTRREKPVASTGLAMLAKGFVFAVAVIMGLSAAPRPAAADEAPVAFISALGTQALSVIRSDMPLAGKAAYFGRLVRRDFDVNGICRFVLGPYWPVASPAERQELCNGFADRLFDFYGRRLAQSGDGNFATTGRRAVPRRRHRDQLNHP